MTDNAVLYAGRVEQCPFQVLGQLAPRAKARVLKKHDDGAWASVELKWPDLTLTINDRSYEDPVMLEGLKDLAGWVTSTWTDPSEAPLHRLRKRLARTRRQIAIIAEPGLDDEGRAETLIFSLAEPTYSVVLFADALWDSDARALMDANGKRADDAEIMYAPSASDRRQGVLSELRTKGIDILDTLTTLEGEEESLVTHPEDVAKRALALWALAAKAEGAKQTQWRFVFDFDLEDTLTPDELRFLNSKTTSQEDRVRYTWHYESVWALLWALGAIEAWTFPTQPCDPVELAAHFTPETVSDFLRDAELRDVTELLDARDESYCLQWACLEATCENEKPPADLHAQVVRHRLRALNWVMMEGYLGWDEVRDDA